MNKKKQRVIHKHRKTRMRRKIRIKAERAKSTRA